MVIYIVAHLLTQSMAHRLLANLRAAEPKVLSHETGTAVARVGRAERLLDAGNKVGTHLPLEDTLHHRACKDCIGTAHILALQHSTSFKTFCYEETFSVHWLKVF